ncbi:polyprotein [rhinovirus C32]|uniref:Genome polyprotein n=1 Tax=rhinovirus C32 TaxID=1219405 RepID=A0A482D2E6_9ENTO|nr:polyprotein [rhinovirus C32]
MGAQVSKQSVGAHETTVHAGSGAVVKYFNINYYKDAASSGLTKQDFSQDPSKFTQPIADVLTNPALMSPSVEACGYSDRLKQITIGSSTITTQDAVNTVLAYGEWPSYLSDLDATSVDKPTHPETSSDRFYTLGSVTWNATSKGWWWKLPDCLKDMGIFGQNMYYHSMGRSGYIIHTQCNATKFNSGCLLVVVVPEHQLAYIGGTKASVSYNHTHPGESGHEIGKNTTNRGNHEPDENPFFSCNGTLLGNLTIFPHQLINLRTNNSSTIVVPYINCTPMDNMLRHNNVSLLIIPICPLRTSNGAPTTLPITISIAPDKSEFSGAKQNQTQGIPMRLPSGSNQFMTTEDEQSPNILPNFHPTKKIHIPGEIKTIMDMARVDSFMPINNIQSQLQDVSVYNVQVTPQAEGKILVIPLDMSNTLFATTLLGEVLNYYSNWSGSIKLSFMCVCDSFSTGKFLIAYTPPGAGLPTDRKQAMLGVHTIWDLGLQSTCNMVIPWISAHNYRRTKADKFTEGGYVSVWYQTTFVSTSLAGCIMVTCSACPDMAVRMMRDTPMMKQEVNIQQNPVENFIDETLKEVLVVPNTKETGPIHTTKPTSLSALEIGATAQVEPEDMIETRYVYNDNSNAETTIENFLGRSALWANLTLERGFKRWEISFQEHAQVRKKFEMFTYLRYDLEITVVTDNTGLMQIMYVPPGIDAPDSANSQLWDSASNPSVFYQPHSGFPRFTIPFTGIASAYYMFYDGYDSNEQGSTRYGIGTTNDMGLLCIRALNNTEKDKVKIFAKPKHITAWIPRPPRATQYVSRYSVNYNIPKTGSTTSELEQKHFLVPREDIKNVGPSDMFVHTRDAIFRCAHLTNPTEDTILLAISSDLQVDSASEPGPDFIPDCDCTTGTYYCHSKDRYYPIEFKQHDWYEIQESIYYPKHIQYNILIGEGPCQPGDCGGKLLCKHGVIGMITAGGDNHVAFIDLRCYTDLAQHQGLKDYVNQLGGAFGEGFTSTIKQTLTETCGTITDKLTSKVVKWLIRIISALTIMIRNSADIPTITATLALLGCSGSPWKFIKSKVCHWLGVQPPPSRQGDSWLKKFTEFCNAARGLEWIGDKLSKFIDWLKSKIVPTVQRKAETLRECKKIPLYKEQVKAFSKATEEAQNELITNINKLEKGLLELAPLYAVEAKQVREIQIEIRRMMCFKKSHRAEPVCILLHGQPGCGKSLLTTVISRGLTTEAEVYSLPPDPKHFDGYNQQHVVIMDDVGQNPDGRDLSLFCQMVSTTEFVVPMASLEDKGKTFTSDYVLASTNLNSLSPPTVTIPEAIDRRFFLDCDVKIMTGYSNNGVLNVAKSLQPCSSCPTPNHYKQCCPLLCGKAVVLQNKRTQGSYSVLTVVEQLRQERKNRQSVQVDLSAIFQGLGDEQTPGFIIDLLSASKDPRVIEYCESEGWIKSLKQNKLERELNYTQYCLNCLGSLVLILGTVYAVYKLMCLAQGPYSGLPQPKPSKPELRKAMVQGPEHEFGMALLKRNCHIATTDRGEFNLLGIHDNCAVLPTHAEPGDTILLDGYEVNVLKQQIITDFNDVDTEITILWLDRKEKFRDIRRFIPEHVKEWSNMRLITNVSKFPMLDLEVGSVVPFGELSLSGNPTTRLMKYNYPTQPGQCGGVIMSTGNIIGIHVGGNGRVGYCASLTRNYFAATQGEIITKFSVRDLGLNTINTPSKTKLHPSVFHDIFPGVKEPAVLSNFDPRLEVDLKESVLSKYKGNKGCEMNEFIRTAVDHYTAQLFMLDINPEPITLEQAIYGTEGLEPLDLNTSAGFPYVTLGVRKKDILNRTTKDVTKLQQMMDKFGLDLPYVTYLKDELRAPEKIRKGKTRAIEAASMNDTAFFRMTFGNLYAAFHKNPGTLTGSAIGCDPDIFWSQIYSCMEQNLLAFDYTNYDGSLDPVWFKALEMVLDNLGFPGYLMSRLNKTTHIFKDEIYKVEGGMPSGISGTSVFNTMINNIILRTLVLETYKNINLDKLKMVAYGDDILASYPDELDPEQLAQAGVKYGLTITPADKSTEFRKVTWQNVTFLKRGFEPDMKHPFLIHPIFPMSEIYESIRWTKDPKNTQDHVYSLCLLSWHNGEEKYNDFIQKVRSTSVGRALYLPPYSVLYRAWIDKFI